jgi:hypothetical protein
MEVSGQLHASAALPRRLSLNVPLNILYLFICVIGAHLYKKVSDEKCFDETGNKRVDMFHPQLHPEWFWDPPNLTSNGTEGFYPRT